MISYIDLFAGIGENILLGNAGLGISWKSVCRRNITVPRNLQGSCAQSLEMICLSFMVIG